MKIENTPENKAKFFALYWGQKIVAVRIDDGDDRGYYEVGNNWYCGLEDSYLELTPLSQITDEDVVSVYNLTGVDEVHVDYLRSKGYALPWMGLSVEDLVSYGWVKVKS